MSIRYSRRESGAITLAIISLLITMGMAVVGIEATTHTETITCTVESKDRASKPKGGSDMRIYTTDCGVLSVKDSLWDGNWSSADRFASIKEGKRYEFFTRGRRNPLLSWFPNIITAREV